MHSCHSIIPADDLYERRVSLFERLPIESTDIVMLGDSLVQGCEWHELMQNNRLKNRGINGDTVGGVMARCHTIMQSHPAKVFIMVGINDVSHNRRAEEVACDIVTLVAHLHTLSPTTRIYVHSLLPFDASIHYTSLQGYDNVVCDINRILDQQAPLHSYTYIELHKHFAVPHTTTIAPQYTNDGLHLTGRGYALWGKLIQCHIDE